MNNFPFAMKSNEILKILKNGRIENLRIGETIYIFFFSFYNDFKTEYRWKLISSMGYCSRHKTAINFRLKRSPTTA